MDKEITRKENKEEKSKQKLLELVLSWSLSDILNENLFKNKVKETPDTFSSVTHYLWSFKDQLIKETRASLCSGLEAIGEAPAWEIPHLVLCNPKPKPEPEPNKLFCYNIIIKRITSFTYPNGEYEPGSGDLVLLTNTPPRRGIVRDLKNTRQTQFVIASMAKFGDRFRLSSVKEIGPELRPKGGKRIYATFLINMTTNMRIWRALNPDPKTANLKLVHKLLQFGSSTDDVDCTVCLNEEDKSTVLRLIGSFGLDESQKNAVLSCVSMRKCPHEGGNLKLIWGPPGTGKTKTVASLLFVLLKLGCRTLTCAPTNIAVLQVAERLVRLVLASLDHDTYGLGNIVLFGNEERLKVNDHDVLVDVFLDYRVEILTKCIISWRVSLLSMISLLVDPQGKYDEYIERHKRQSSDDDDDAGEGKGKQHSTKKKKNNKKKKNERETNLFNKSLKEIGKQSKHNGTRNKEEEKDMDLMTFTEFVLKTFYSLADSLVLCTKGFYTHLPTSHIPLAVVKQMIRLNSWLKGLQTGHKNDDVDLNMLMLNKDGILEILTWLRKEFPELKIKGGIVKFCLSNADLVFCTASSSIKITSKVEMVIIDEAAQLKECESVIPIQVPGAKNAILIGDDRQLPAMVQSKVSEKAKFGRSLFERQATLGKKKHLLNVQYRMHPNISSFPNREFYDSKIVDGPNVKETSYERNFLKGSKYGSYSFINVALGKEDFHTGHSPRNMEEAKVVSQIVGKLFKEHLIKKQRVSVGVIAPYKGQVGLINEMLGKKYAKHAETGFNVSVRSVDGFQGGEEDLIIISTVRSNQNGSVGFLSNHQRTNVALTRARYCLWIVGNGAAALVKKGSVWKDLVIDAKVRGWYFNVEDQDDPLQDTLDFDTPPNSKWKIFFSDDFKTSIAILTDSKTRNKAREMVNKLARGWCESSVVIDKIGSSEPLENYKVHGKMHLVWSIDIMKQESKCSQVIRVWDILPASQLPKLAEKLNVAFGRYTVEDMNRCKEKRIEGKWVVPMSWPVQSIWKSVLEPSSAECLVGQLAAMTLHSPV